MDSESDSLNRVIRPMDGVLNDSSLQRLSSDGLNDDNSDEEKDEEEGEEGEE